MNQYIQNVLAWLSETWEAWLAFALIAIGGWLLYYYLFEQRTYRAIDGKAQVKHGRLGRWVDLKKWYRSVLGYEG